jgi:alpha-galactosidase
MIWRSLTSLLFAAVCFGQQLALTPPMGWNSRNKFAEKIDAKTVKEIADAMVSSGMKDAGYIYVNIDDAWQGTRDAQGVLQPNEKFPDMKGLADYVHSKGLKIGIYSSPGPKTCAGFEGSYQHEELDARTWAAWGIDYLKYDWCSAKTVYKEEDMPAVYKKMGDALKATGRPIVFSLCQYGLHKVWEWGAASGGNLWRTTGDIEDIWKSMSTIGFDKQTGLEQYAGPGHWNDPDTLEIGNGKMDEVEYKTHMALWAMLAAPLLAGNDLRNIEDEIKQILTNREVIAIDQDKLGKQGFRVSKDGRTEIWVKPLEGGDVAVALFNRGDKSELMIAKWSDAGFTGKHAARDLWAHADRGKIKDLFEAEVSAHGVVMLRVSK